MKKLTIPSGITRKFHKTMFQLKKHSPEILVIAGVTGTVVSAVLACKATTKVNAILEKSKEDIDGIHSVLENPVLAEKYKEEYGEEYTEEASKKDLALVYVQTGVRLAKLYGPAIVLGTVSITAILASNNILRKRNVALAAAYTVVDKGFKEYRGRVIERFGEDLDRELRYNIKSKEVEETVVDENGKEKTVKTTVNVIDPNDVSQYARFFDELCTGWTKDRSYNLTFLRLQQNFANQKLQEQGYLFLNEVYEMLGIPKTKEGHVVGWIYDEACPVGDNFVDFGIYDPRDPDKRAFVNGHEPAILLDFNVDGNVYDMIF